MNKWRKKPIIIEAYDFSKTKVDKDGKHLFDIMEICPKEFSWQDIRTEYERYFINTLEGKMLINPDDFIIIGIKGEKYPCKRDIFFATYEKVDENEDI